MEWQSYCEVSTATWAIAMGLNCAANAAIRFCFVDTIIEFRCIRRVSQKRFHESAPRFPPLAPARKLFANFVGTIETL